MFQVFTAIAMEEEEEEPMGEEVMVEMAAAEAVVVAAVALQAAGVPEAAAAGTGGVTSKHVSLRIVLPCSSTTKSLVVLIHAAYLFCFI